MISAKRIARRLLRPPLHKPEMHADYVILGSDYGGWPLMTEFTDSESVIYSFGIGEDITFDMAAIGQYKCRIFGFDPTPRSKAWLASQTLPEKFTFYPVGIAAKDGEAEFFAPATASHASYSHSPSSGGHQANSVRAPVMRLENIISNLSLPLPSILKMDIEGFEYGVISDLVQGSCLPQQLLVEFHHGVYQGVERADTVAAVRMLQNVGYRIYYVSSSGREYGFHRPEA